MSFVTGEEGEKFKPPHRPMTHPGYWPCKPDVPKRLDRLWRQNLIN